MYKDIISYRLSENISEEHLLQIATKISKDWMQHQSGFIRWEIHKNSEGGYTDIVYWQSKQDAQRAESGMKNIANAGDWIACYAKDSISSQRLSSIASFDRSGIEPAAFKEKN